MSKLTGSYLAESHDALIEVVKAFISSGVEFDNPGVGYVVMQVDRWKLTEAKALIARAEGHTHTDDSGTFTCQLGSACPDRRKGNE